MSDKTGALAPNDPFDTKADRVLLTGTQALVVAMLLQAERDASAGLKTGGFVSGYRGSPLGGLDTELWRAGGRLGERGIVFVPGVNEDLAATAVWGSQMAGGDAARRVDGVFAMWYGKGAGLDRSGDAMRHAHGSGTSRHGGVLAVVGDDHALKSSSQAYHSEPTFHDLQIPVLAPSSIEEMIRFALIGWEMSRRSGCWVGLKTTAELLNSTTRLDLAPLWDLALPPAPDAQVPKDRHFHWPDPWPSVERRLLGDKLPAAIDFAGTAGLNAPVLSAERPRLGVVASGRSVGEVMDALDLLGLTPEAAAAHGIAVFHVAMPWPLESARLAPFLRACPTVLVVEEKRAFVESQILSLCYRWPEAERPEVLGERDRAGKALFARVGELTALDIAEALGDLLPAEGARTGMRARLAAARRAAERLSLPPIRARGPYFCSGCPHNTSTRVPEGAKALAGVGCHYMAVSMDRSTETFTQMGGEGVPWIGWAPFTATDHVFVNLGEGTYFHSGSLAIRACVAAKRTMTFKLLFNDAVAMTGGQPVDGTLTVPMLADQLRAEGVARIEIVADDPGRYANARLPTGVDLSHRDDLEAVQNALRAQPGVSVLIYDQVCATEKRRRVKRGKMPAPPRRLFINEAVCEGCGDCGVQSNCLSLVPKETAFGRKRAIDQSSCNTDYSCLKGFCPSFVSVRGAVPARRAEAADAPDDATPPLAEPRRIEALDGNAVADILVTGVGGTGVVTIGVILALAADIEGLSVSVHDKLGMAQKYGGVASHIRLSRAPLERRAVKIAPGGARVLVGGDAVESASPAILALLAEDCRAVVNTDQVMTGDFTRDPDLDFKSDALSARLSEVLTHTPDAIDATSLATAVLGDAIWANMLLLGYVAQKGWLPLAPAALEQAIARHGMRVDDNIRALRLGRRLATGWRPARPAPDREPATLEDLVAHRHASLVAYRNEAYAADYARVVETARAAEARAVGRAGAFTRAVAKGLYKVMAYKDEYEVARLYTDGRFQAALTRAFEGGGRVELHLAPPLLARKDKATGLPRKSAYGPWIFPVLKLLARLKGLRGTAFDPFGYTAERKAERALIGEYRETVARLCETLTPDKIALAVEIAELPLSIRGFGHVKQAAMRAAACKRTELLGRWDDPRAPARAARAAE